MEELPVRYVCINCHYVVATATNLIETRDDVVVFCSLQSNQEGKMVVCPVCELGLGKFGDNYTLRKDRVMKRDERLEILICILKKEELTQLGALIQDVFPQSNVTSRQLQKSELRGFQLSTSPDFVVVAHRNEGRVLLTDRNGFYHDVLGSAWQQTWGNVLIVLTRTEPTSGDSLFDESLVHSLSTKGDQPTIGAIASDGRVLSWESEPSRQQREKLHELSVKAYFKEPPQMVQGIPAQWAKLPSKPGASNWCALL
jgi:hypothetical protein